MSHCAVGAGQVAIFNPAPHLSISACSLCWDVCCFVSSTPLKYEDVRWTRGKRLSETWSILVFPPSSWITVLEGLRCGGEKSFDFSLYLFTTNKSPIAERTVSIPSWLQSLKSFLSLDAGLSFCASTSSYMKFRCFRHWAALNSCYRKLY